MTLWQTMTTMARIMKGKGIIASWRNHAFPITGYLILKRKQNERAISTLSYFSLSPLQMRAVYEMVEEVFHRYLPSNDSCSTHHSKLQKILAAQSNIREINEAKEAIVEEVVNEEADDEPQVVGEAKTAMENVCHVDTGSTLTLQERQSMLNADNFHKVKNHLLHQKRHEAGTCSCLNFKPLHII